MHSDTARTAYYYVSYCKWYSYHFYLILRTRPSLVSSQKSDRCVSSFLRRTRPLCPVALLSDSTAPVISAADACPVRSNPTRKEMRDMSYNLCQASSKGMISRMEDIAVPTRLYRRSFHTYRRSARIDEECSNSTSSGRVEILTQGSVGSLT